jgi:hypothetical protein
MHRPALPRGRARRDAGSDVYATLDHLRDEGVTAAQASDDRLTALIDEASSFIDRVTGWFFEPRALSFRMDGRGAPSIEPPAPPIRVDRLSVEDTDLSLDDDDLIVVGAPVQPGFDGPRLTLRHGRVYPQGQGNVEAEGLWGYTESDGTPEGRVPLGIRRACILLVLRWMAPLGDEDAAGDARNRWRIIEERTRDQSYKLDSTKQSGAFTGDPEIDSILGRYQRPIGMGAA